MRSSGREQISSTLLGHVSGTMAAYGKIGEIQSDKCGRLFGPMQGPLEPANYP